MAAIENTKRVKSWYLTSICLVAIACGQREATEQASNTSMALSNSGLVAAYGFDEPSGDALVDATGNEQSATLSGQSRVLGRYGGALGFLDNPLSIPNSSLLQLSDGMTLSAWVIRAASPVWQAPIVGMSDEDWASYGLYFQGPEDVASWPIGGIHVGDEWRSTQYSAATPLNVWTHLALTYDSQTLRIYQNGELVSSDSVSGSIVPSSGALRIGGFASWQQYYRGRIDEVRVYNRALSEAEIEADMATPITAGASSDTTPPTVTLTGPVDGSGATTITQISAEADDNGGPVSVQFLVDGHPIGAVVEQPPFVKSWHAASATPGSHVLQARAIDATGNVQLSNTVSAVVPAGLGVPGLVAAYGFEEPSGDAITDVTGAGNDATLNGQLRVAGRYGRGLEFSASVLSIADSDLLDLDSALTLSAWVLPEPAGEATTPIFWKSHWGWMTRYALFANYAWTMRPYGEVATDSDDYQVLGGESLSPSVWNHLTVTYDAQTLKLYQNGVLMSSTPASGHILSSTDPLSIGAKNSEFFRGRLDELRIYNRALDADEILADMNSPVTAGAAVDTIPPVIQITAPSAGSTVSGLVELSAEASDAGGPVTVQFLVDGIEYGAEVRGAPHLRNWLAAAASEGEHVITARATDPTGNVATSAPVTVTIASGTTRYGLVAAFGLDESGGDLVRDATPAGHQGILSTQTRVSGRFGNALRFDGTSMLSITSPEFLDLGSTMTLSAWVLPESVSEGWEALISKGTGSSYSYRLYGDTNSRDPGIWVNLDQEQQIRGGGPLSNVGWSYVAATYDNQYIKLYVNGRLVTTSAASGPMQSNLGSLALGGDSVWGNYYVGRLDEVRIYNRALSESEINADMLTPITPGAVPTATVPSVTLSAPPNDGSITASVVLSANVTDTDGPVSVEFLVDGIAWGAPVTQAPYQKTWHAGSASIGDHVIQVKVTDAWGRTSVSNSRALTVPQGLGVPGLVAAWGFDELSGDTAIDSTGAGHNTVLNGQNRVTGRFGSGLEFGGSALSVADSELLDLTDAFTLEAWVLADPSQGLERPILLKSRYTWATAWSLYGNIDWASRPRVAFVNTADDWNEEFGNAALSDTAWTHLAATFDGETLSVYLNGSLSSSRSVTGPIVSTADPLFIGGIPEWGEFFSGRLDEIRIYNRALRLEEIQADMLAPVTAGADVPTDAPLVELVVPDGTITGSVMLSANIANADGPVSVQFFADGVGLGAPITHAPYQKPWHAGSATPGDHTFYVRVTDLWGNVSISNTGTLTVLPGMSTPGLVAAWAFEETGDSVVDSTGAGHEATLTGQSRGLGRFGRGLHFSNALLQISNSDLLQLGTGMTLSAWVLPDSLPERGLPVLWKSDSGWMTRYGLYASYWGNPPFTEIRTTEDYYGLYAGDAYLDVTTWTHLAATFDGASLDFYRNGELIASKPAAGSIDSSGDALSIGGIAKDEAFFVGTLDEIRIYNRALTASEISADMQTPIAGSAATDATAPEVAVSAPAAGSNVSGLVTLTATASDNSGRAAVQFFVDGAAIGAPVTRAPYQRNWLAAAATSGEHQITAKATDPSGNSVTSPPVVVTVAPGTSTPGLVSAFAFDEVGGDTVRDSVPTGQIGTLSTQTRVSGRFGNSLFFDGQSSLPIAVSDFLELGTSITVSAWVLLQDSVPAWKTVLFRGNGGCLSYLLYGNTDDSRAGFWLSHEQGWAGPRGEPPLSTSRWTYLTGTYDGRDVNFYLDGDLVGTEPGSGAITHCTGPLEFGGNAMWGEFIVGRLDEVRIYNRALSELEIEADMVTPITPGATPPTTVPNVTLITPPNDGTISDNVLLTVNVSDADGGVTVQFLVDGVALGTPITEGPYQLTWDTSAASQGDHLISVQVTDAWGRVTTSGSHVITVPSHGNPQPSGPIAAYGFEEGMGAIVRDQSAAGHNGVLTDERRGAGKIGQALEFAVDALELPGTTAESLSSQMTLSAWVLPRLDGQTGNGAEPIVWKGDGLDGGFALYLVRNGTALVPMGVLASTPDAQAYRVLPADPDLVLPADTWSYLSITYGEQSLGLYVNGSLVGTLDAPLADLSSPQPVWIGFGNDETTAMGMRGSIDEVRIYDRALSQTEIAADMLTAVTPQPWQEIDSTPPTITLSAPQNGITVTTRQVLLSADVNDDSGFVRVQFLIDDVPYGSTVNRAPYQKPWLAAAMAEGNHTLRAKASDANGNETVTDPISLTVPPGLGLEGLVAAYGFDELEGNLISDVTGAGNDATITSQSRVAGKYGGAIDVQGAPFVIADSDLITRASSMTLSAWVMPDAAAQSAAILLKEAGAYWSYALDAGNDEGYPGARFGYNLQYDATPLEVGVWTHLAATFDGDRLSLYRNGTLMAAGQDHLLLTYGKGPLTIGGDRLGGVPFVGRIDEVRIYNRVLTPAEIQAHLAVPLASGTGTDQVAPVVQLTAPANGSVVAGTVTLEATATDNVGVQRVEFLVDETQIGDAILQAPYRTTWLAAVSGTHRVRVQAYDAAGNVGSSTTITVTVATPCDPATVSDGNPCTLDSCGLDGQPLFAPVGAGTPCSNGNRCDGIELCNAEGQCQAGVAPTLDATCDDIDDDCDGAVDEDYPSQPTTCGQGACLSSGSMVCRNGAVTTECVPGAPAANDSLCNGIDDDCDGAVDEDYVSSITSCGSGSCQSQGTTACVGGVVSDSCRAGTGNGADTICNGIDDDCDGQIDEDYVAQAIQCGVGVCVRNGSITCEGGTLVAHCTPGIGSPSDLSCDHLDDDCDGQIDEDYQPRATQCGVGACVATGTTNCVLGIESSVCQPSAPAPSDASCNGIDDDCDGIVDEDYASTATTCGMGACANTGVTSCSSGVVTDSCVARVAAANDATCNGIDDDCNGIADEDYLEVATQCGVGACAASGALRCQAGQLVDSCMPGAAAANDTSCNGIDDDCNGQIDEDYVATSTQCGSGACLSNGSLNCVGGHLVDSCSSGTGAADDAACDGVDSNCNGQIDEGYQPHSTSCGVGVCRNTSVSSCLLGVEQSNCQPGSPTGADADCDGLDNDCDGQIDEAYVEQDTVCGVGACASTGRRSCVAGREINSCVALTPAPVDSTCNGVDDDCDGQIDEDYVAQATTCGSGACQRAGSIACQNGVLVPVCSAGTGAPNDASCNGIDDDCDGQIDEDYVPQTTNCGIGACLRTGTVECQAGTLLTVCSGGVALADDSVCNGIDDDCDGHVDEDYVAQSITCGTGACQANGTTSCVGGVVTNSCTSGSGSATDSTCNGIDDDCDGRVDEDYVAQTISCGVGACVRSGTVGCEAGALVTHCTPGTGAAIDATCDGLDDDCSGQADEDYQPRATQCGVGACASTGTTTCVAGVEQNSCSVGASAPNDTTCNGIDDDCDGQVDEDYAPVTTYCGTGACVASGTTSCAAGVVSDSCAPRTPAATDATCNGVDDNCNGQIDEDYVEQATSCGIGACAATGVRRCQAGQLSDSCAPGTPATADATCNGIDDDCDGQTDENYVGTPTQCGAGACLGTGALSCVNGRVVDSCSAGSATGADTVCDGIDSNCNNQIDEGYVSHATNCGVGVCRSTGVSSCALGVEQDSCRPGNSTGPDTNCDGQDDDCDGQIDEGYVETATQCGVGACVASGRRSCVAGSERDSCVALAPAPADATCDGIDDDCNGQADEDYVPVPTHCGTGACQRNGSVECRNGVLTTVCTVGSAAPNDASCNGIDDDCDGQVDEDYLPQSTSCGVGACLRSGTVECQQGAPATVCAAGSAAPNDASCNGIDDDCDGQVDEDYVPESTTCGIGACRANGTTSCVAGQVTSSCTVGSGSANDSVCNGLDDDCDGQVDEDYAAQSTNCGVGVCARTGTTRCVAGQVQNSCQPGSSAGLDDNCDGLDDDCDGTADNRYASRSVSCGIGACAATGTTTCLGGVEHSECQAGTPAANDVSCNGVDDDCDGSTDEEFTSETTHCGIGACASSGQTSCVSGATQNSCQPKAGAESDATCDGIDDDCSGQTDEDYVPVASSCGIGACASEGQRNCVAGKIVDNCQARSAAPDDTSCNGVDDDCNGQIDEDFVGQTTTCGTGACAAQGRQTCSAGRLGDDCTPSLPAGPDTNCDGIDNDCDGGVDEEYPPVTVNCGVGACAATGATSCSAGKVVQNCHPGSPTGSDNDCNGIDDDCDGAADEAFVVHCSGTAVERCVSGALQHQECQDTNPCNGTESCNAGACQAGSAPNLSDGNACTADTCDPLQGILHPASSQGTDCGTQRACDGQGNCIARPQITQQPESLAVAQGQTAVFAVQATGESLSYQWRRMGQPIAGATSNSYARTNVTLADQAAEFTVVVSNAAGSVTSSTATLSVQDLVGPALTIAGEATRTVTTDLVTLTGSAIDSGVAASSVVVRSNRWQGEVAAIVAAGTGTFTAEVPLSAGQNQLTVVARDAQNNSTEQVVVVTLAVSSLPTLTITSPSPGSRITADTVDVRGTVRSSLAPEKIRLSLGTQILFPEGSNGEYTFLFPGVRLTSGVNALTVRAETSEGAVTTQVVVTQGAASSDTGTPPAIRVTGAQSDLFVNSSTYTVSGTVSAERCVSEVTVNGASATVRGAGASVSFERTLMLPSNGVAQPIAVVARDCDGRSSTLTYNATFDDLAPTINVGLPQAPAVHTVTTTPFLLAGSITEPNLAGFTVGQQSIGLLPGAGGTWDFTTSIALTRAVDTPIELVAWDRSGNRSSYSLLVRLDAPFELEVIAPKADEVYTTLESQQTVSIVARVVGLPAEQNVTVSLDAGAGSVLNRGGDTFTGALSIPVSDKAHQLLLAVREAGGTALLSKTLAVTVKSAADVPLEATLTAPLNESANLEVDQAISIKFNRPIDPSKFALQVRETVQGKQYKKAQIGAGLGNFNSVALEDVSRSNEPVPGGLSFLPGNQFVAFYPSREYGYGAALAFTGTYDGREVVRGSFSTRPLPTLMAGFVTDQFSNPIEGIQVSITGATTKVTETNQFGAFSFGYGEYVDSIPGGRYRLTVNPGLKDRRYGIAIHNVDSQQGRYQELGVLHIPVLSENEPFRRVASGEAATRLAGGTLILDLSQAELAFPDGQQSGEVHTQLQWNHTLYYPSADVFPPLFAFAIQPMGIGVAGSVGVEFELPAALNVANVLQSLHDLVLISALDANSLQLVPVGVARIDPLTHHARTERPIPLTRLDLIAVTPMPNVRAQAVLARFAAGEIDLNQLTMSLTALR